jgi:hypothetical protein
MDLNEILNKTKAKSEKIKTVRKPPSIAMDDRPYTTAEAQLYSNSHENKLTTNRQQSDNKLATNRQQTDNVFAITKIEQNKTGNKPTTNRQQKSHFLV